MGSKQNYNVCDGKYAILEEVRWEIGNIGVDEMGCCQY